jgi:hypothetical protein
MTDAFLKELKGLEFDSLTAKEAVLLRSALTEAMAKADEWFAALARNFGQSPPDAGVTVINKYGDRIFNGRPPEPPSSPVVRGEPSPVKTSPRRRGRPVPNLKVDLKVNRKPPPAPIAVGGADAAGDGPKPAQLFQDSYVSKDGPRPGAALPADHPRNFARPSSVTPEVDMGDFHEVEEAMHKNQLGKMFQ